MSSTQTVENVTRSAVKLVVAVVGLLLLRAMIGLLPGSERTLPGVGVPLESLLIAGFMLLIAGIVVYYGYQLWGTVADSMYASPGLREAGARVILGMTAFLALITVYDGLERIVDGVAAPGSMVVLLFDTVFLVGALLILLALGYTVLQNLDPFIDSVVDSVTSGSAASSGNGSSSRSSGGGSSDITSATSCPDCGADYPQGAFFCADCGTSLSTGTS